MSTPTSPSRKRKADALEIADGAESPSGRKLKAATTPSTHLPASCLAAILNFMEYAEVRRCLLAGKIMAVDAARHVEALNIMNTSELVPSAARRFANVTEVNILSLVKDAEEEGEYILSVGTATRSVVFLTTFPKLKRAYLGGIWRNGTNRKWTKYSYASTDNYREPKDHLSVFRGLVDQLCGAFQSRSLSSGLRLGGVVGVGQTVCDEDDEREDGHRCRYCWNIVASFPLDLVLKTIPGSYPNRLCLSSSERIEALLVVIRRDNHLLPQSQAVVKCFLSVVGAMLSSAHVFDGGDIQKSFVERIMSRGGRFFEYDVEHFVRFHFISVKNMDALKRFAAAIGPSVMNSIPKRELLSAVRPFGEATDDGKKTVMVRETFESLVQLGFDLASKEYVLIDPLNEDALGDYHHLFRSEEEAS